MSRLIKHIQNSPVEVKVGGDSKWICRCGLSKNQPFCNGTHKKTLDEDSSKLYAYDEAGNRVEIKEV